MYSAFLDRRMWLAAALALVAGASDARELRICADPNNLPFSNDRGEGFENKLAELLAQQLGARTHYTWWAQRRGFIRNTLRAGLCDLVMGMPTAVEMVRTTAPYYRSSYVFVTRADQPEISSLDDPLLRKLRIGVQLVGDDGANTPPGHALARRGIIDNVRGYALYGDYRQPHPPARIVTAVADGEIDLALVWGPLAGYFSAHREQPLRVRPVEPSMDWPMLPMAFDISLAVRREEEAFRRELERALEKLRPEIDTVLREYRVPRADRPGAAERTGR